MEQYSDLEAYEVMSLGGDTRIVVDDLSGRNGYGCSPLPQYTISYSSSTSNNISMAAYAYVQSFWHDLLVRIAVDDGYDGAEEFRSVRKRIKACYEVKEDVDIVLGSSGTDLELVVLALVGMHGKGVHNIVLGANEVGSGIENAAKGRYFSALTPLGGPVKTGAIIPGLETLDGSYANVEIRDEAGHVRSEQDVVRDVDAEIAKALERGRLPIMHVIHRSKTGLIIPRMEALRTLIAHYGEDLHVLVDACQGRISIRVMNEYLAMGAAVLFTGSKFYSGPPFSGALLLPASWRSEATERQGYITSLSDFFTRAEFPLEWKWLDGQLIDRMNPGLLLRWEAAIYEMQRVFMVPNPRIERVINSFAHAINGMITESGFLRRVKISSDTAEDLAPIDTVSPFELNTIITFEVCRKESVQGFSHEDARIIYRALYSDLSEIVSEPSRIAGIPILLGQPVKVERGADGVWNACLRVSLSSSLISELAMLEDGMIDRRFAADMDMLKRKLELILSHWDAIRNAFQQ